MQYLVPVNNSNNFTPSTPFFQPNLQESLSQTSSQDTLNPSRLEEVSTSERIGLNMSDEELLNLIATIPSLSEKYANLESKYSTLQSKCKTLDTAFTDLSSKYTGLEAKCKSLEKVNASLKSEISTHCHSSDKRHNNGEVFT